MNSSMRNKVQRKFKMRGYTLTMEGLMEIFEFISRLPEAEDEALDLLLDELHNLSLESSILDKEPMQKVMSLLLEAEAAVDESPTTCGYGSASSALKIIDVFDVPNFDVIQSRNCFMNTRESSQFMVMLLQRSCYIEIAFSCCIKGSLMIPIFPGLLLIEICQIVAAVRYLQFSLWSAGQERDGSWALYLISAGGWPFLCGRFNCSCARGFIECNIIL